jgi:hypothetical protein
MRTAFGKRLDVMYFLHRRVPAVPQTFLTKWVSLYIPRPNLSPLVTVSLIRIRVTAVVVILKVALALVAVAVVTVRQIRATGIGTGLTRFVRYNITGFRAKQKPSQISPQRLLYIFF